MGRVYFLPARLCEVIHSSGRFRNPPRIYVASVSVSIASATSALASSPYLPSLDLRRLFGLSPGVSSAPERAS